MEDTFFGPVRKTHLYVALANLLQVWISWGSSSDEVARLLFVIPMPDWIWRLAFGLVLAHGAVSVGFFFGASFPLFGMFFEESRDDMMEAHCWLTLVLFVALASMFLSVGERSFLFLLLEWVMAIVLTCMLTVSALSVSVRMVARRGKGGHGDGDGDESGSGL